MPPGRVNYTGILPAASNPVADSVGDFDPGNQTYLYVIGFSISAGRLACTGHAYPTFSIRSRSSAGIDAGNSTYAGILAMRRGAGGTLMCFSTVAVGFPIAIPFRSQYIAIVVNMHDASPAAIKSVGENAEASPPMSLGASVLSVAPSG